MRYNCISTDDHLQEKPDTWTARMSAAKWGDKIPHVVRDADGGDTWWINGEPRAVKGPGSVHATMADRTASAVNFDEMPPKAYIPAERVKAMEADGVDVHTFFANVAGIAGNTFYNADWPADFRLDCIRAYNDFQVEEYAEPYPGRFITLAQLPMWDLDLAVAELRRAVERKMNGIAIAFPQQFGYPDVCDPYWDPLWDAAQETNMSVNFHIGSGGAQGISFPAPWEGHNAVTRLSDGSTRTISANIMVMSTILFSGILERFPALKVVSSESGLGWAPYLLEVADHQWEAQNLKVRGSLKIKPSDYFHRQCYINFWFEAVGLRMRDVIGMDNIMWSSDFPHPTSTFPKSQWYIERAIGDWSEAERRQVLVDNAVKVFNLNGG